VSRPLPPPLPPAERTVGQLVAESMRLYGQRFWRALPLGLPLAVVDQLTVGQSPAVRVAVFAAGAPFLAAAYAGASALTARTTLGSRTALIAIATGTLVLLPASILLVWFALLAAAYLALVGLVVPVAVVERVGVLRAFRRAGELARVDYVHAVGSLATLAIVFFIARIGLVALLHGQADNTVRAAVFIADVVLGPLLFLGAALLYFDQEARLSVSGGRGTMGPDARIPRRKPDAPGSVRHAPAGRPPGRAHRPRDDRR
jgi:hypothetical protein